MGAYRTVNDAMTAIAEAIRTKTGGTESLTLDQMATEIAGIEGSQNPLLYAVQSNGLYYGVVFPDGYELKIVAPNHGGKMQNIFSNAKGIRKVTMEVSTETEFDLYGFVRESSIEEVVLPDGIHVTSWNYFAYVNHNLRKVIGRINLSGSTSNGASLNVTNNLEEVYFMPGTIEASINISSEKLIDASVQSVIDGLADLTGQTTQKLTLKSAVCAKLTDTQKATITAKNWTLVY